MHDQLRVRRGKIEKLFADPEQIIFCSLFKLNIGANTRMYKENLSLVVMCRKGFEKGNMLFGDLFKRALMDLPELQILPHLNAIRGHGLNAPKRLMKPVMPNPQ